MRPSPCARCGLDAGAGRRASVRCRRAAASTFSAYLFDPDHPEFADERCRLTSDRVRRAQAIVDRLRRARVPIVLDRRRGGGGRRHHRAAPHRRRPRRASASCPTSSRPSPGLDRPGRPGLRREVRPRRRERGRFDQPRAGGVPVLAHPLGSAGAGARRRPTRLSTMLAAAGLAGRRGRPSRSRRPHARPRLRRLARAHDLIVTGSSDYHGANKAIALGAAPPPSRRHSKPSSSGPRAPRRSSGRRDWASCPLSMFGPWSSPTTRNATSTWLVTG